MPLSRGGNLGRFSCSRMKIPRPLATNDPRTLALNILIGVLILIVGYLAYSLLERHLIRPPVDVVRDSPGGAIIQVDILNGCGVSGAATVVRDYLRARGYDVVEMRNYKSFDVEESRVVDRTGESQAAEKVAYALGINKARIIRQINPDYYVDVSVIVGKDYKSMKSSH
jgi:hypothetical protein